VEPSSDHWSHQPNSLHCHSLDMAWFANVAQVEWWELEASGELWSQVVSIKAEWQVPEASGGCWGLVVSIGVNW